MKTARIETPHVPLMENLPSFEVNKILPAPRMFYTNMDEIAVGIKDDMIKNGVQAEIKPMWYFVNDQKKGTPVYVIRQTVQVYMEGQMQPKHLLLREDGSWA